MAREWSQFTISRMKYKLLILNYLAFLLKLFFGFLKRYYEIQTIPQQVRTEIKFS